MVGERGFHTVSIDAVARRAGITRPVVYGHFDNKAGLLRALVEREGAHAVGQLMELLPRPDAHAAAARDPARRLARFSRGGPRRAGDLAAGPDASRGHARHPARARVSIRRDVTDQLAALAPQVTARRGWRGAAGHGARGPHDAGRRRGRRAAAPRTIRTYPIERLMTHAEWLLGRLGLAGLSSIRPAVLRVPVDALLPRRRDGELPPAAAGERLDRDEPGSPRRPSNAGPIAVPTGTHARQRPGADPAGVAAARDQVAARSTRSSPPSRPAPSPRASRPSAVVAVVGARPRLDRAVRPDPDLEATPNRRDGRPASPRSARAVALPG